MWKTEKKMNSHLIKTFSDSNVENQTRYEWCKKMFCLPYDFCINDKILIELDGQQHSKHVKYFHKTKEAFNKCQEHDKFKNEKAIENDYQIIRVFQEDYMKNKNDCVAQVDRAILNMKANPEIRYCFIPSNNKYVQNTYDEYTEILETNTTLLKN